MQNCTAHAFSIELPRSAKNTLNVSKSIFQANCKRTITEVISAFSSPSVLLSKPGAVLATKFTGKFKVQLLHILMFQRKNVSPSAIMALEVYLHFSILNKTPYSSTKARLQTLLNIYLTSIKTNHTDTELPPKAGSPVLVKKYSIYS